MGSRAGIAVFVMSTSACGVLAFSTDELSSERAGDGGVTPQGLVDGQSAIDGAPVGDGAVEGAAVGDGSPLSPTPDGSPEAGPLAANCPANPCPSGSVCCYVSKSPTAGEFVCQQACADGKPMDCVGPQQCGASRGVCCGTVRFGEGPVPSCPISAVSSVCSETCLTNFGLSCNVTNTMRLCHERADCESDPDNKNCCTYTGSGVSAIVCVSDLIRDFAGLACLP